MSRKTKQVEQAAHHAQEHSLTDDLSLLTVADVAALLAVPKSTVYRLVRRRQLESVRLGRYFPVSTIRCTGLYQQPTGGA